MNKEQIQQKFDEILTGLGHEFWKDGTLSTSYITKNDLLELLTSGFNLGLEVAADNAEADYEMTGNWNVQVQGDIEVYVIKNSILKHKLWFL